MSKVPDPEEVKASEKEAVERKTKEWVRQNKIAAKKKELEELETVDLTEKPTPADDRISQANTAAARMEAATEAYKIQNDRQEAMKVEATLGGETAAGGEAEKPDENAGAKALLAGTGYEDMFDPPKDDPNKKS